MDTSFDTSLMRGYTSGAQQARVLTEDWVDRNIFCPNCGFLEIDKYDNNRPVADFYCTNCNEEYELKSKKNSVGKKIVDGAYKTMIERLESSNNSNFFILNYDLKSYSVNDFIVIPKHFFTPGIIEKRKPLAITARRAGWVGCNILFEHIPSSGKIFYVKNGVQEKKEDVLSIWKQTLFLREEEKSEKKGWILDVLLCLDKIKEETFTLGDVYKFESALALKHPNNKHIKDKIRQQLQMLRDKNIIEFKGGGVYRRL